MLDPCRIGIFGRSKSGKSTLMNRLMRSHRRTILFDHVAERAGTAAQEGFTEVQNLDDLQELVDAGYGQGFRLWFRPNFRLDLVQALSDLSDFMMDIQEQFADRHSVAARPSLMLAVDEMANCFPNHALKKDQDMFSVMCREGRHKGIHLIGATQRPAEVSTKFRGQLEKRFIFNLTDAADLEAIEKMGGRDGRDLAEAVRLLHPLEYIRMENGSYTSGKLVF